ncbi:glutaredoxin [Thiomicrospira aerophila AL3]|uniref:Glutaredoxin n=1 Tax=Thiomicrospira aerophila AL3 TaxID=717772 RepID=W0DUE0_9GAMM|nr:glutaredoxin 3 [Thiomicrospira aerophila]AHF00614.1 glutaredoxin [Thiomicrospira aerophila AL3]
MNCEVIVYANNTCPYCSKARKLLEQKGVAYTWHNIDQIPNGWQKVKEVSGRNTIPQIFIGDHHVGGCDDLYAADKSGQLDELLAKVK